jgi:hypothetical protein
LSFGSGDNTPQKHHAAGILSHQRGPANGYRRGFEQVPQREGSATRLVAKLRRECRALLDQARDTEDHDERGGLYRRAPELAAAEVEERRFTRPKP